MNKRLFTACLLLRILLAPVVVGASEPPLQYQSTGSTPLLYRAHFREREETATATSFIRFDQEKLEEKKDNHVSERRLVLTRSVRRQGVEERLSELSTRIVSLIETEKAGKEKEPLPSQRIAEFFEATDGTHPEAYALEAIPYFGIPLSLSGQTPVEGQDWNASWHLQAGEGLEVPFLGHYRIDRIGLLAGHWCVFVSYNLKGESGWEGQGSFAFDLNRGVLVTHQGRLLRKRETEEFQESARVLRKRETLYEMAEVLVP